MQLVPCLSVESHLIVLTDTTQLQSWCRSCLPACELLVHLMDADTAQNIHLQTGCRRYSQGSSPESGPPYMLLTQLLLPAVSLLFLL